MLKFRVNKLFLAVTFVIILLSGIVSGQNSGQDFSFVFMTDIHIESTLHAPEGFSKAINEANGLGPDFVITGGDLVFDAMKAGYSRADSLFNLYCEKLKEFREPVFNTPGNHDNFRWFNKKVKPDDENYGIKMFQGRIGKSYQAFIHKGWKFFILNDVVKKDKHHYEGYVDQEQIDWLRNELKNTPKDMPLVISVHIPFITFNDELGSKEKSPKIGRELTNYKQVLDLFRGYNLKIVLQGHMHYYEDIYTGGIHFITGGAVSGAWWTGPHMNTPEGFVVITIRNGEPHIEYHEYGWKADTVK